MLKADSVYQHKTLRFNYAQEMRLNKAGFDLVMKKGVKVVTPFFVFLYHRNTEGPNQLGLIIAKKNIPLAVQRNRYRRISKESFRLNQHTFVHTKIVVIVRRVANPPSNAELHACLAKFWSQLASL